MTLLIGSHKAHLQARQQLITMIEVRPGHKLSKKLKQYPSMPSKKVFLSTEGLSINKGGRKRFYSVVLEKYRIRGFRSREQCKWRPNALMLILTDSLCLFYYEKGDSEFKRKRLLWRSKKDMHKVCWFELQLIFFSKLL